MDMLDIIKNAVDKVENNNSTNNAKWSDWKFVGEIIEFYTDLSYFFDKLSKEEQKIIIEFLEKQIDENGKNIITDYQKIEYKTLGFNYTYSVTNFKRS
jgi:hypothetical protein